MAEEKADLLDAFMALDNALLEFLLHCAPATDAERAEVEEVKQLRTRLQQHTSQLVVHRLRIATAGVRVDAARLLVITKQVQATAGAIAKVKEVAEKAGEALGIAGQVAGKITGGV